MESKKHYYFEERKQKILQYSGQVWFKSQFQTNEYFDYLRKDCLKCFSFTKLMLLSMYNK